MIFLSVIFGLIKHAVAVKSQFVSSWTARTLEGDTEKFSDENPELLI